MTTTTLHPLAQPVSREVLEGMTRGQRQALWYVLGDRLLEPECHSGTFYATASYYTHDPRLPPDSIPGVTAPYTEAERHEAQAAHVPDAGEKVEAAPQPAQSTRDAVLTGALKAVSLRDNEAAYGTGNSFAAAARIRAAILSACPKPPPPDVGIAITQIAVKLARLAGSMFKHEDSAVDLCGYGAWAHQLATAEASETDPKKG